MKINILFFGQTADFMGVSSMEMNDIADITTLKEKIFQLQPDLKSIPFLFSLNKKITNDNSLLNEGDEIGILPPFSGG